MPSPAGQADINARVGGSTAGTVRQGGQEVFASSAAPGQAKAKPAKKAKKAAAKPAPESTVSQRSATSDLWSRVASGGGDTSLDSAAASAGGGGGLGSGAVAAIAVLGLALVGITGGALATAGRRRRAAARSAGAPDRR